MFNLQDTVPRDLQDRFHLSADVPDMQDGDSPGTFPERKSFYYDFDLDAQKVGIVKALVKPDKKLISCEQFYPLGKKIETNRWLFPLPTHPDLRSKGLGALAHILLLRDLYKTITDADSFNMEYPFPFGMTDLLDRFRIHERMKLKVMLSQSVDIGNEVYGFEFDDPTTE